MNIQSATTGNLQRAQNILIAMSRFTAEHNAPCVNLIEKFTLGKGNYQLTLPKVGQQEVYDLVDGQPYPEGEDIGLGVTDMTTSEVGSKCYLSKKLIRQFNEDVFKIVGRQQGDAMARKRDKDVIALFPALNASTTYGVDNADLSLLNASACVANLTSVPAPSPMVAVHHPIAIATLARNAAAIDATYYAGILGDFSEELLRNFWRVRISGVNFFQDGNIAKSTGADSGYGAIFSKSAMAYVEGLAPMVEREYNYDYRSWILYIQADYGVYEIDDSYGAPMLYEIGALSTT